MNHAKMTATEMCTLLSQADLASAHERLLSQARTVAERMTRLVDRLNVSGPDASVNELGELQSYGTDLDRLCTLFTEKRRAFQTLERLAGAEQRARA